MSKQWEQYDTKKARKWSKLTPAHVKMQVSVLSTQDHYPCYSQTNSQLLRLRWESVLWIPPGCYAVLWCSLYWLYKFLPVLVCWRLLESRWLFCDPAFRVSFCMGMDSPGCGTRTPEALVLAETTKKHFLDNQYTYRTTYFIKYSCLVTRHSYPTLYYPYCFKY